MPLSVLTTISNCQARGSDLVGVIPYMTGSAYGNASATLDIGEGEEGA